MVRSQGQLVLFSFSPKAISGFQFRLPTSPQILGYQQHSCLNKGCCCTDNVQCPALDMAGTVGATVGPQSPLNRNLERLLEEAQISGELRVSSRRLREFPKVANKYNLNDTVYSGK